MAKIKDSFLPLIKEWYFKERLSMREIAERIDVTWGAVYYSMRKHGLRRRTHSEQNLVRFERKKPSFLLPRLISPSLRELRVAGTFLYWAEGYKRGDLIDFTNSDSEIIAIFMQFLRRVCGVRESKIRIKLFCYPNQNPQQLSKVWSQITGVPLTQFNKPYIRRNYNQDNTHRMAFGLVHVIYSDKKLLLKIKEWMKQYSSKWAGTKAVKRGTL